MSADLHTEMEMDSPPHSPVAAASNVNMQEMDMEQDDEDMNVQPVAPQPPPPPRGAPPPPPPVMIPRMPVNQMPLHSMLPTTAVPPTLPTDKRTTPFKPQDVIIKDYNPKDKMVTISQSEQYLISPITKEKIPASSISAHTKYGKVHMDFVCFHCILCLALLDPNWIQRREKELAEQQEKEHVYEPGSHVGLELKKFAERRTDIFGTGAQETIIGKKVKHFFVFYRFFIDFFSVRFRLVKKINAMIKSNGTVIHPLVN